jgi:hypothetical protein
LHIACSGRPVGRSKSIKSMKNNGKAS